MSCCGSISCVTSGRGWLRRRPASAWKRPRTSPPRAILQTRWARALPAVWILSDSSRMISGMDGATENGSQNNSAPPPAESTSVFYDGASSRRRAVQLVLKDGLEINENGTSLAVWPFAEIRRADSAAGILRMSCVTAPSLARLEVRDGPLAAALTARCPHLHDNAAGRHGVTAIVGWSVAATVSIVAMIWFGLPLAADRLAPLVPSALERRIGDAAEGQIVVMFGAKTCSGAAG